ncbi:putative 2-aminoethylphosphonate ABC transporter substrate-binding protein [Clostridium tetani]|uniref:Putative 2-aminoethylphosphonate ABC transporter substrate-binding protein n=1 Tax=Clostridium tetani TaxID=1513 RepID=A0A4Q0VB62_CLOTA|nr:putative 2-aminoethylphosphonate ABC transporter substrate-binding protein [Clostridium tetani]RXI47030.1 putative 2-aminoethylphosphonate ABC transporter substrate-binding protein [Clostridium tetani]
MKKLISVVLSFIMTAMFFSGCNSKSNREITVYTAVEDNLIEEYIQGFNKVNSNIKVNIVRGSTGDITSKLLAEKDKPVADVVWGLAATSLIVLDETELLKPCKVEGVKNINSKFIDTKNKEPHWIGLSLWTNAITANLEEMKNKGVEIPKSYKELLKPEYKNQISMPNPASSGTGFMFVSCLIQSLGEKEAWNYLDKINESMRVYEHSGMGPIKSTEMGEQFIGLGMGGESLLEEKKHKQIKTFFPKEGLAWDIDGLGIINKENVNDSVEKFVNYILSDEAMEIEAKSRNRIVTLKNPITIEGYPKNVVDMLFKNDLNWASNNKSRIIEEWNKRYSVNKK